MKEQRTNHENKRRKRARAGTYDEQNQDRTCQAAESADAWRGYVSRTKLEVCFRSMVSKASSPHGLATGVTPPLLLGRFDEKQNHSK